MTPLGTTHGRDCAVKWLSLVSINSEQEIKMCSRDNISLHFSSQLSTRSLRLQTSSRPMHQTLAPCNRQQEASQPHSPRLAILVGVEGVARHLHQSHGLIHIVLLHCLHQSQASLTKELNGVKNDLETKTSALKIHLKPAYVAKLWKWAQGLSLCGVIPWIPW